MYLVVIAAIVHEKTGNIVAFQEKLSPCFFPIYSIVYFALFFLIYRWIE